MNIEKKVIDQYSNVKLKEMLQLDEERTAWTKYHHVFLVVRTAKLLVTTSCRWCFIIENEGMYVEVYSYVGR